jgi:non-specific serine/threonine protein kinase
MPFYSGRSLLDLRRTMPEAPDEASLRALLDDLLGALEAIHRGGRAHGGVTPGNVLLLGDDRPLLLGPGAAAREIGSDLVDSLMASLETPPAPEPADVTPSGPIADLYALAEVIRFCITGTPAPVAGPGGGRESMAEVIARSFEPAARPRYSAELLGTLDAAMSPLAEDWPLSVAQFRTWLARGAPRALPRAALRREALFAAAAEVPAQAAAQPAAGLFPEPPRRPAPDASTIRAHAEPPTAPMTTDRAPWLAPPVRIVVPRKRRGRKLAMAGALAGLAVVVLAVVSGAWDQVPAIALDHLPKLGFDRPVDTPAPVMPTEPIAKAPTVAPAPAPEATAASANVAPPVVAEALPASASVPVPQEQAPSASASVPAPQAQAPSASASVPPPQAQAQTPVVAPADPATTVAAAPDTSAKRVEKSRPAAERPRRAAAPAAARQQATTAAGPRAACAGKSEFALYRCMQQQCDSSRWYAHPQCIRLRSSDRVD